MGCIIGVYPRAQPVDIIIYIASRSQQSAIPEHLHDHLTTGGLKAIIHLITNYH